MNEKKKSKSILLKILICCVICALVILTPVMQAYAIPTEQGNAIQQLLDDAIRISGTPGISVAVISGNQTHFFNAGHTSVRNRSNATLVDEHTLYEIGSTSKAFTAVGILLLEEQGLLSTSDRIEEHLPWFYLTYQNEVVAVTIQQLLNHTSGLTQAHSDAPRGEGADMLRRTVEPFVGARLAFAPGTAHSYGNANYNILGLIIEYVTGQSYESFMIEQVFEPLGLHQTFLFHSEAIATGRMAQGHRHAFFMTFTYNAPRYGGMKPTGFIISSTYDMARWMGIHLGIVQDIPDIFLPVIERAHQPCPQHGPVTKTVDTLSFYAGGWINNPNMGWLSHAGQTPSFLCEVVLWTEDELGIVFLSNDGSVDLDLTLWIRAILDGDLQQSYLRSFEQIQDMMFSVIIAVLTILSVYWLVASIRNRKKNKPIFTKSKIILLVIYVVAAIYTLVDLVRIPSTSGQGWLYFFDWGAPTNIIMQFMMPIASIILVWYAYTKKPKKQKKSKEQKKSKIEES